MMLLLGKMKTVFKLYQGRAKGEDFQWSSRSSIRIQTAHLDVPLLHANTFQINFRGLVFSHFGCNPLIWGCRLTGPHIHSHFYLHSPIITLPAPDWYNGPPDAMEKRHCHPQRFCLVTWCLSWLQIADLTHPAARFSSDTGGDQ